MYHPRALYIVIHFLVAQPVKVLPTHLCTLRLLKINPDVDGHEVYNIEGHGKEGKGKEGMKRKDM